MAPTKSIVSEGNTDTPPDLRILHFNDVYHLAEQSKDPCGGIARFQALCDHYRHDKQFEGQSDLLTFFSGDAFSPSLEATVFKGNHMVPFLNNLGIDAACVGNHDYDWGVDAFKKLVKQCKFPWLLSNIFELDKSSILAGAPATHMVTSSNGIKIGLIGIAEQEWISTVNSLPLDLPFMPAAEAAQKYAAELRAQGAEMIIALCHQREVNDNHLAATVPAGTLDIILAGHDHDHRYSKINGCHVLCSGSDFKQLSYIEARRKPDSPGWDFDMVLRDVTRDIKEDEPTARLMDKMFASFRAKLQKPLGFTTVPLDARFETVRKAESNYANFICDLLLNYYRGDCAIIVGGTFRADTVYTPGVIRMNDIVSMFPFTDPEVVINCPGQNVWQALEHAVSSYPSLEGRFPQLSNIELEFDPSKPAGSRVISVKVGDAPLDLEKSYKLVTRAYTVAGGDGFTSLKTQDHGGDSTWIIDEEHGQLTSTILRQYFMSLKVIGRWKNWTPTLKTHWSSVNSTLHKTSHVSPPTPRTPRALSPVLASRPLKRRRASTAADTASTLQSERQGQANPIPPLIPAQRTSPPPPPPPITTNGQKKASPLAIDSNSSESDTDTDDEQLIPRISSADAEQQERRLQVARRTIKKWRRKCGLKKTPGLVDALSQGVCWTQGIAPVVTGRIRIVGVNA